MLECEKDRRNLPRETDDSGESTQSSRADLRVSRVVSGRREGTSRLRIYVYLWQYAVAGKK